MQNLGPWDIWKASDKTKILVYQQGLQGAEFGSLRQMEGIRLKKNSRYSWYASRGCTV